MNCKNCYTELHEQDDYCRNCGAKVIRKRLTFKNLFEHVSETFFNYDNKLLRTFLQLFKQPEDVIVGYINGVRKRYVNVFSYFALAITISGLQILIIQKFQSDFTFYDTSTEIGVQQQAIFDKVNKFTTEYQSLVMMLYIPFYALIAKIVFLRTKAFNYTELLVVFMYTQAQISICVAFFTAIIIPLNLMSFATYGMSIIPLQFIYFVYTLKRIYKLNKLQMFLRTMIFLGLLGVLFILMVIVTVILMFQSGQMQEMIEAQKAARAALL
ncbi:MAG: DUF3667 domain-containing protein [Bacteroidota bacterium]